MREFFAASQKSGTATPALTRKNKELRFLALLRAEVHIKRDALKRRLYIRRSCLGAAGRTFTVKPEFFASVKVGTAMPCPYVSDPRIKRDARKRRPNKETRR